MELTESCRPCGSLLRCRPSKHVMKGAHSEVREVIQRGTSCRKPVPADFRLREQDVLHTEW